MKTKLLFLVITLSTMFLSSCDYLLNIRSYDVIIHNDDTNKSITSVYVRAGNTNDYWSKNKISDIILPNEESTIILTEGTYEFKVITEDDYYSYEMYMSALTINSNTRLNFCYECYLDNKNVKVIKIPKNKK